MGTASALDSPRHEQRRPESTLLYRLVAHHLEAGFAEAREQHQRGLPGDDRRTGELLALAKTGDVIDAHLALGVDDGDRVLTSDPDDINCLLEVRGVEATVIRT